VGVPAQGWYRDPFGLHEDRYFSEGWPTKLVRDRGVESFDLPPDRDFSPADLVPAPSRDRSVRHDFARPSRVSLDSPFDGGLPQADATGWYRDPYGLHQDRYFSRNQPTKLVRDDGIEAYDPPPDTPVGLDELVPVHEKPAQPIEPEPDFDPRQAAQAVYEWFDRHPQGR
jgi:hypothetical protein